MLRFIGEATSFRHCSKGVLVMCDPDFWTISAEAMDLTIKGNRLIVREIAEVLHRWWNGLAAPAASLRRVWSR
jgi:hypothetical protein